MYIVTEVRMSKAILKYSQCRELNVKEQNKQYGLHFVVCVCALRSEEVIVHYLSLSHTHTQRFGVNSVIKKFAFVNMLH
jgi:hypothetical protein